MMNHRVISDDGLKITTDGCSIDIRLPWYRALPLSVVEVVSVGMDGADVDLDRIRFELEGETLELGDLRARTTDMWYVLDSAHLRLDGVRLERGSEHDVAVTLAIYPPYIKGYKRMTRTDKRLSAR